MDSKSKDQNALGFYDLTEIIHYIPDFISLLRIIVLPHLVYAFNQQLTLVAYSLFLFSIGTDLLDGFVARKLNSVSRFGAYLDVVCDFLFIFGMYLNFSIKGLYSTWILLMIIIVFSQFVISNIYLKQTIYDPIGKYFGSLLFGGIGLTLLFSYSLVYQTVSFGILISTVASLVSRLVYLLRQRKIKTSSTFHS
jgi:phosphatidylglycerophosphate synthase